MRTKYVVAAVTAAVCGMGGAAALATHDHRAPTAGMSGKHCVLDVATGSERCFADYRQAMRFASGGAITDAPADARLAVGDRALAAKVRALGTRPARAASGALKNAAGSGDSPESSVIAATLFTGTNYTGESETIRVSKPCAKDGKYDYGYRLGTIGQHAKSVQPWADCWIWLHEGESWDSARQGPYKTDTPDLGDWKDRAVLMGLS